MSAWPRVRLGDVAELNPRRPKLDRADDDLTTFIPMSAVAEDGAGVTAPEVKPFSAVRKGYTYFADGDVIFAKITPCMQNGKHAIVRDTLGGFGFGSTELHVLRPLDGLCPEWLHYFLIQPSLLDDAKAHFTGAVGQQRIPDSYLAELTIPLPAVEEQQRITAKVAAAMVEVAHARAAAAERAQAATCWDASVLRSCFPLRPPVTVDTDGVQAAPDEWEWVRLTEVARLESGHTPSRSRPDWWGGDVPWLALPDIRAWDGRVITSTTETTNADGLANSSSRLLPEGTVALSRTASVGFVTLFGKPMATSQDFVNWVCGDRLRPRFLMHALRASRAHLLQIASGAIHKTIYMNTVESFRLCLPSLAEQDAIVGRIDGQLGLVDLLRPSLAAEAEAIDRLPGRVLEQAFTGN